MLDTRQLQQLVAVADHDTITEAAASLYLTQPALSRSLRKIEIELGVDLFDRSRRNSVRLNSAGDLAVERSREILKQLDSMARFIRENGRQEHSVSIGACTPPLLWEMVLALASAFPGISFSSTLDSTPLLEKRLLSGEIQISFLAKEVTDRSVECFEWQHEKLYATFPQNHPLYDAKSVSFSELSTQSFLLQTHIGDWNRIVSRMMPDSKLLFQEDRSTLMALALDSSLPTFMSNFTMNHNPVPKGRSVVPLVGEGSELPLWCAFRHDLRPDISSYLERYASRKTHD